MKHRSIVFYICLYISLELELGELLHDDLFGLFEAMSAIEMMDPKMDAGMRCNRQAKKPYSFQSALEVGHFANIDILKSLRGRFRPDT